jgi:hypothetical protein
MNEIYTNNANRLPACPHLPDKEHVSYNINKKATNRRERERERERRKEREKERNSKTLLELQTESRPRCDGPCRVQSPDKFLKPLAEQRKVMQLNVVVVRALDPKRPVRTFAPLEQNLAMSDGHDIIPRAMHNQHRRGDLGHLERDALGGCHNPKVLGFRV